MCPDRHAYPIGAAAMTTTVRVNVRTESGYHVTGSPCLSYWRSAHDYHGLRVNVKTKQPTRYIVSKGKGQRERASNSFPSVSRAGKSPAVHTRHET